MFEYDDYPFDWRFPVDYDDRSLVTLRGFVRRDGRTLAETPVAEWVAALRSGDYSQATGQLARNGEYCCLGVACSVAVQANVIGWFSGDYGDLSTYPQVQEFFGLASGAATYGGRSLIDDNDDARKSFAEIADIIESRPEGLFR